jgi:hypothetical protein
VFRKCRKWFYLLFLLGAINCVYGEDENLVIFWQTVSPNGRYALAWTKSGSIDIDDMPRPTEADGAVKNWLIDLDSKKRMVELKGGAYWHLPAGGHPNHFDMETVWSDDSSSLLVIYDSRWNTDLVFVVSPKLSEANEIGVPMQKSYEQILRRDGGNQYNKHTEDYAIMFASPWFVKRDQFEIIAYAAIPKATEGDFSYALIFGVNARSIALEKATASDVETAESSDRQLNRAYRSLSGLLKPREREALIQEERKWINQRDATADPKAKEALVRARVEELIKRRDNLIEELSAAQGKGK